MAVEKNNEIIEEEARVTEEVQEQPEGLPVDVTVEGEEEMVEERPQDDFNANLAEDMDERTLQSMASDLIAEYKKDKNSRKEWEEAYIKGLELLGTKYQEVTKPLLCKNPVSDLFLFPGLISWHPLQKRTTLLRITVLLLFLTM